jgi:ribose/xylose/arabinose/galactoside ABC-type transport system permease subunit
MALGSASVGPIQASSLLFLAIGILLHFMLKHTSFGVKIYATGADTATAKALGVNTRNTVFYTYTLIGAVAGVGGLAYAGFTGAVTNNLAMGEVFWTFAGTIIAGVAMRGGSGSMINVMGGALFIGLVTTGTLVFQVTATQRMVIAGIIILISILISRLRETWEEHLLKT